MRSFTNEVPKTYVTVDEILVRIREEGPLTAAQVGIKLSDMKTLEAQGFLTQKGNVQTGHRGRPALRFGLTLRGANRAWQASKSVAA